MNLEELKIDSAKKQKKGLHFILASIIIWGMVAIIHRLDMPILTKNLWTFCATAPLLPLAYGFSKIIRVKFSDGDNPLNKLGILFSMNQLLYLLIAMWVYPTVPDKMVMVIAMIFGAHLLPYGWLYMSKSYTVMAILIPISALILGNLFEAYILAIVMMFFEIIFSLALVVELKKQNSMEAI
jgi:hypothetical protein